SAPRTTCAPRGGSLRAWDGLYYLNKASDQPASSGFPPIRTYASGTRSSQYPDSAAQSASTAAGAQVPRSSTAQSSFSRNSTRTPCALPVQRSAPAAPRDGRAPAKPPYQANTANPRSSPARSSASSGSGLPSNTQTNGNSSQLPGSIRTSTRPTRTSRARGSSARAPWTSQV